MREGFQLTVHSSPRSESVIYEFSGQSFHENLSVTCKGTATKGSGSPKAGSDERTPKRRGGRPHGRRSAAAPGASAEPARWTAGWCRLRPSDADAPSAAGPGRAGSDSHGSLSVVSVGGGHVVEVQRTSRGRKSRARTQAAPNKIVARSNTRLLVKRTAQTIFGHFTMDP